LHSWWKNSRFGKIECAHPCVGWKRQRGRGSHRQEKVAMPKLSCAQLLEPSCNIWYRAGGQREGGKKKNVKEAGHWKKGRGSHRHPRMKLCFRKGAVGGKPWNIEIGFLLLEIGTRMRSAQLQISTMRRKRTRVRQGEPRGDVWLRTVSLKTGKGGGVGKKHTRKRENQPSTEGWGDG